MPAIVRQQEVGVSKTLSGAVQVRLGDSYFRLSPDEAIKFGAAILREAGVMVEIGNVERILSVLDTKGSA